MGSVLLSALLSVCACGLSPAWGETGVTPQEVRVGMSNALSGPAARLGTRLKAGVEVYFGKVNAAGGVHGRKLKLISYDDAYEPGRCAAFTAKLVDEDRVFALLGYVGTPTSTGVLPLVNELGVPFVAPLTGAASLRSPVNRLVYNVRGSYADEMEYLVEHLTHDLGVKRIGILVQNDSFGAAGEDGVMIALRRRSLSLCGKGSYKRNTEEVGEGLAVLQEAKPEAVILVGTYKPLATAVKQARAAGFNPRWATISFVGTEAFMAELGPAGEGVFVSQVLPSPFDERLPFIVGYQRDMKAAGESPDYGSLEGYVDAAVFVEGLRQGGVELSRASFLRGMDGLQADLGGLQVSYSPTNHQALRRVHAIQVQGGKAVPVSESFR
nr:ABC transporter substrate-binding protein [uncultured Holophaga sp.]